MEERIKALEESNKRLETATARLMRRASKRVIGLITPYPISNAAFGEKVEGVILRYMFPCDGKIAKGMMMLGAKPKKWVGVNVKIFNETKLAIKGTQTDKRSTVVDAELELKAGDCLEVSLTTAPEDVVKEVWISFLWIPHVKEIEAKSFLISELENDLQEEQLT